MARSRLLVPAIVCLALSAPVQAAWGATKFRPRLGGALGLVPPANSQGHLTAHDVASGPQTPVTYHGGSVMAGGVTVHTIFWAPPGFAFQGSPAAGVPTYEGLIEQFFTDVAADSGASGTCTTSECNAFTVEPQYAEGTSVGAITPGSYSIGYDTATDSINDTDPYPSEADQCASPSGTAVCITDGEVQTEVDHIVQSTPGTPRGPHNLWFVFLPPGVDECILAANCGTNAFAGYHSASNVDGHGPTIYAVAIDPIIEVQIGPGADPEGSPDAEATLDTAAHETSEAMSDPEGTGWMDPNGFEIGDKCDIGPQIGTPLGFAADGSPYNQVINGHRYLLQDEWANVDSSGNADCVQASTTTTNQLPLPQVNLRQFNPMVTGDVNRAPGGGIRVQVTLVRTGPAGNPVVVARVSSTTAANGSWAVSLAPHAIGDDRDELDVDYSGAGAPQPAHQVILTGNGGNPLDEAGWTSWFDLDNGTGSSVGSGESAFDVGPCFQVGTLSFTFDGAGSESPNDFCNTQTDSSSQPTSRIGAGDALKLTSADNRAFAAPGTPTPNLLGGLVSLTVPVGEPGSVSAFTNLLTTFTPGGFPSCAADLELQAVQCVGLVPGRVYRLTDGRQRVTGAADATGIVIEPLRVRRGNSVALSNGSRALTTLHIARLKVRILGEETFLAGGRCQAGDYYGQPPVPPPASTMAGGPTSSANKGSALTGEICPMSGRAAGLPAAAITQTDELSGGQTETEVPDIEDTSPMEGETMNGRFTALAESGLTVPGNEVIPTDLFTRIALRITTAARGATAFRSPDVNTARGVSVPALRPGNYDATWTLNDANGDTRVVTTRFIEHVGRIGPGPRARVACGFAGGSAIRCAVDFTNGGQIDGTLRIRLTRGAVVVALGNGPVRRGRTTITAHEVRLPSAGAWRATLVLSEPHLEPVTTSVALTGVS